MRQNEEEEGKKAKTNSSLRIRWPPKLFYFGMHKQREKAWREKKKGGKRESSSCPNFHGFDLDPLIAILVHVCVYLSTEKELRYDDINGFLWNITMVCNESEGAAIW